MMNMINNQSSYLTEKYQYIYVVLCFISVSLGNSLDPISILVYIQSLLLLLSFYILINKETNTLVNYILITISLITLYTIAITIAFLKAFAYPTITILSIILTILYGLFYWLLIYLLAVIPQYISSIYYPSFPLNILVYPTIYTFVNHVVIGYTLSTFTTTANALVDYESLKQLASINGNISIDFYISLLNSFIYHLIIYQSNNKLYRSIYKYFTYYIYLLICLLFIGGFINTYDTFYQQPVTSLITPYIQSSCIFSQLSEYQSISYYQLLNQTTTRLDNHDQLILFSEEAISIYSTIDENELIHTFSNLLSNYNTTYLGVTYVKSVDHIKTNNFVFINPSGVVVWRYSKAHPVPFIESDITAGPNVLPTAYLPEYDIIAGGAICFDYDYPSFIHQASIKKVDLMLQPSWTWQSINYRHFNGNAMRSVENGFTMFRCSSMGQSGVVNHHGQIISKRYSLDQPIDNDIEIFYIPIQKRFITIHSCIGYIFEYFIIIFSVLYILLFYSAELYIYLSINRYSDRHIVRYINSFIYKYRIITSKSNSRIYSSVIDKNQSNHQDNQNDSDYGTIDSI